MEPKRNLLTIGESSEYLRVSIDTLRRWEKKGRITPYRSPGGHRYYEKEELDTLFGKRYMRDENPQKKTPERLAIPYNESVQVERKQFISSPQPTHEYTRQETNYQRPQYHPSFGHQYPNPNHLESQNFRGRDTILIPQQSIFTQEEEAPEQKHSVKQLLAIDTKEKMQIVAIIIITALVVILAVVIFILLIQSSRNVLSPSP